jgi:DNA-binding GntR family transcriptional regulator
MTMDTPTDYSRALELIEFKIFTNELKPRERLIERELIEEYGISRGAVRQMLKELANKHLIVHNTHRGAVVAEPTAKEVEDIYQARVLLEGYAIDAVVANMQPSIIDQIKAHQRAFEAALKEENLRGLFHHNRLFHGTLFAVCGNDVFIEMIDQLRKRSHIWYRYFTGNPGHRRSSIDDHSQMIACLEECDTARLKRVNKRHLTRGYRRYKEDQRRHLNLNFPPGPSPG